MATQLFVRDEAAADLSADVDKLLELTRGAGSTGTNASTVTGPTAGVQIGNTKRSWWYRVDAVTISGTITKNFWMSESNMSANVTAQVIIDRCDSTGAFISTVQNSEFGTELPVTTRAAQNWTTGTVTSTNFATGDYIRVQIYGNDATATTMASGFTFEAFYGGPTAAADGDSYVTFTETIPAWTGGGGPAANPPQRRRFPQLLAH